jgi:hypothetical protein
VETLTGFSLAIGILGLRGWNINNGSRKAHLTQ